MKTRIKIVIAIFLLSVVATACSFGKSTPNTNNIGNSNNNQIVNISNTSNPGINATSEKNSSTNMSVGTSEGKKSNASVQTSPNKSTNANAVALKEYKGVLQNKIEFYNTNIKKNMYFNSFLTNNGLYDGIFKAPHFTLIDMDGDKIPEIVIELVRGNNDYADFYEVLHYADGKVFGYIFSNRALGDIKYDGTFGYSSGSRDNGYGKLKFQGDTSTIDEIGYRKSTGTDYKDEVYFIRNQQVTSDRYDSFETEQRAKQETTWYELSQNSIEKELSASS